MAACAPWEKIVMSTHHTNGVSATHTARPHCKHACADCKHLVLRLFAGTLLRLHTHTTNSNTTAATGEGRTKSRHSSKQQCVKRGDG